MGDNCIFTLYHYSDTMPLFSFFFSLLLFYVTNTKEFKLLGEWEVKNEFFSARYQIKTSQGKLILNTLYYNDGVNIVKTPKEAAKQPIFQLTQKGKKFVDAISGASTTAAHHLILTQKEKNSLEAMHIRFKDTLREIWTQKNTQ